MSNRNRLENLGRIVKSTDTYQRIDTLALVDQMGLDVESAKLHVARNSSRHHLTFPLTSLPDSRIGGDIVHPTLHVFNSYAGDGALMVAFGLLRAVCQNGLVAGTSVFSARAIHLKGPKIDRVIQSFDDRLKVALSPESVTKFYAAIEQLDRYRCDRTDIERILDEMKLSSGVYHMALTRFENPYREADVGDSAWLAYNRVQEVIAHYSRGEAGVSDNRKLMDKFFEEIVNKQERQAPKLRLVG